MQEINFTNPLLEFAGLPAVADALKNGQTFLVTSHQRPDGDAVGSVLGLAQSLIKDRKKVDIGFADQIGENFSFLVNQTPLKPGMIKENYYDYVISLDCGDLPRTGFEEDFSKYRNKLINIDHHISNNLFGSINLLDANASSTCEIVLFLLLYCDLPLNSEIAECLYLGLVTDGRFFQNESMRYTAHVAGAVLLNAGLKTNQILSSLTSRRSIPELKVLGMGLGKIQTDLDGKLASVLITAADIAQCNAVCDHVWSCGLFNQITSLKGVIVGFTVVENGEGVSFCEFRSKSGFDVKEIAVALGGGGHLAASGCHQPIPANELYQKAMKLIREKLSSFNS
ncbi:MAG: DHH family phosphoesterase [Candidatus Riflebacteria bacterium]|nr:DHH family phosphoesterase [Candidatus Riflebacteria bacterium]